MHAFGVHILAYNPLSFYPGVSACANRVREVKRMRQTMSRRVSSHLRVGSFFIAPSRKVHLLCRLCARAVRVCSHARPPGACKPRCVRRRPVVAEEENGGLMDWACAADTLPVLRALRAIIPRGDGGGERASSGDAQSILFCGLSRQSCERAVHVVTMCSILPNACSSLFRGAFESLGRALMQPVFAP
jgi:hypothetical protein